MDYITFALPKGRLMKVTSRLLKAIGVPCPEEDGRRLVLEYPNEGFRLLFSRPSDVPTYVQYGAADLGICGKDTLLEFAPEVYEVLDLGFGGGSFVLAVPVEEVEKGFDWRKPGFRVATKLPRIASDFFQKEAVSHHIIKVHGAAELAPKVGLAEMVFDISATGVTLAENGLKIVAEAGHTTARLVANSASYKIKAKGLSEIIRNMKDTVARRGDTLEDN